MYACMVGQSEWERGRRERRLNNNVRRDGNKHCCPVRNGMKGEVSPTTGTKSLPELGRVVRQCLRDSDALGDLATPSGPLANTTARASASHTAHLRVTGCVPGNALFRRECSPPGEGWSCPTSENGR